MRKIPSLFERDWQKDVPAQPRITNGCEWVFDPKIPTAPTKKHDGTCCLVWGRKFYKRRTVEDLGSAPTDFVEDTDLRGVSSLVDTYDHHGWVPVGDGPNDQYHMEGLVNAIAEDAGQDQLPSGTYELVGPKIQGNPHDLVEHTLWRHGAVIAFDFVLPSHRMVTNPHETVKHFLEQNTETEGLVFHEIHGDRAAKVKRTDFGLKWPTN